MRQDGTSYTAEEGRGGCRQGRGQWTRRGDTEAEGGMETVAEAGMVINWRGRSKMDMKTHRDSYVALFWAEDDEGGNVRLIAQ